MAGENPTHIPALDAYPDLEDINRAAEALGLVVAAFLDDDLLPLDALYTNPVPCKLVLTRQGDLYTMLKESHVSRNFDPVRNHVALRRQQGSSETAKLLSEFLPHLLAFVNAGWPNPWSLPAEIAVDDDVRAHIESLRIPNVFGAPNILLRDLGRFSEDAMLANRVDNIFMKGHHTFLVNTSGSGKTRLAFEGLCQHWGFFFVGEIDLNGIGSADLESLITDHIGGDTSPLQEHVVLSRLVAENVKWTQQCLRKLLLARLLVFAAFTEHVGTAADRKKLWLLIQALPHTIGPRSFGDIFSLLISSLGDIDDSYTKDYIDHLLAILRGSFGEEFHMFFVLDEAQTILGKHETAFREDGESYPILREMLDGWHEEFHPHEISFVTVATSMPKSGFQNSRNFNRHRWCSDTGAFDNEDLHCEYVSRYLPPSYVETTAGKSFLRLVWDWCRGRYRFTDSLMATLARDGFRSPHSLLNDYVERGTGYRPQQNLEFVATENDERADIKISRIQCAALEFPGCTPLSSAIRDVLFYYSVAHLHPQPLSIDHIEIIDRGFGRFLDRQMSQIVIDEPIMLVATAKWFCTNSVPYSTSPERSQRDSFLDVLRLYPPTSSQAFLTSLVIYITYAFAQGHSVSKVFSFPPSSAPVWAKQKAEVVALHRHRSRQMWHHTVVNTSTPLLATTPTTPEDLISWLAHDSSDLPPFCLPSAGSPDLIFVLRLTKGKFVHIVLKACATTSILRSSDLEEIIEDLNNDNLFTLEDPDLHELAIASLQGLPLLSSTARRPAVLRVIATFPAQAYLATAKKESTRGVAGLNTGLFKTLAAKIPASEVFKSMVEAVTSGRRSRKRPPAESESSETTKRQKTSQRVTGARRDQGRES